IPTALQFTHRRQRLLSRCGAHHQIALAITGPQIPAHGGEHLRVVVHDEEHRFVHDAASVLLTTTAGSTTRNSVRPGRDSTGTSPSLWRTRRRTMSRPRPVP